MKFKRIHSWDLSPRQAINLQNRLRKKIKLKPLKRQIRLIAAADVSFKEGNAIGVVAVVTFPELKLVEYVKKVRKIKFPYIPGLLTFREGPILEECFQALKSNPEVIIFDGQGLAHPRNMGIATHLGIFLDKPTIGCAKTRLWGKYQEPKNSRGSFSYLLDKKGKKLGAILRTRNDVKPVFVSPGHKMNIHSAIRLILSCTRGYRLPEPIRLADHLTKQGV